MNQEIANKKTNKKLIKNKEKK